MSNQNEARQFEDIIMNQFIKEQLPLFTPDHPEGDAKYDTLDIDRLQAYDLAAFKYFQMAQKEKSQKNSRYGSMEFENFVKLHMPDDGFTEVLRSDQSEDNGPAKVWNDIYNRNTPLFKESALKGLKRMIAAQM